MRGLVPTATGPGTLVLAGWVATPCPGAVASAKLVNEPMCGEGRDDRAGRLLAGHVRGRWGPDSRSRGVPRPATRQAGRPARLCHRRWSSDRTAELRHDPG